VRAGVPAENAAVVRMPRFVDVVGVGLKGLFDVYTVLLRIK
jgi:hypothetical protein